MSRSPGQLGLPYEAPVPQLQSSTEPKLLLYGFFYENVKPTSFPPEITPIVYLDVFAGIIYGST